jgi:hypothetical protein
MQAFQQKSVLQITLSTPPDFHTNGADRDLYLKRTDLRCL